MEATRQSIQQILDAWFSLKADDHFKVRKNFDIKKAFERFKKFNKPGAIGFSLPDWLYQAGQNDYGSAWPDIASWLNKEPAFHIRANALKCNRDELLHLFMDEEVEARAIKGIDNGIEVKRREGLFRIESFRKGFWEPQDASSQKVAEFASEVKAKKIIDACAGAGGKTLQLSAMLNNKGKIWAVDLHQDKLLRLKKRAARAGVFNFDTVHFTEPKSLQPLKGKADLILIDAPCSGTGVLRRNPDIKWRIEPENIARLQEEQQNLLRLYAGFAAKNSYMLYSTCSILKAEGEMQVGQFLEHHSDWKLVKELRIMPKDYNGDGFYMALMKKEG
jgi:16S rRNA (cytosine967-C5)-methyltransferase